MEEFKECECSQWQYTARTKSNGVVVVSKQCLQCGASQGEVKKEKFDVPSLPKFDQARIDAWIAKKDRYWAERKRQFQHEQETRSGEWWEAYKAYLKSDHWWEIRRQVLNRDPICQFCLKRPSVNAHHLTYASFKLFKRSFSIECVGACEPCHTRAHEILKESR